MAGAECHACGVGPAELLWAEVGAHLVEAVPAAARRWLANRGPSLWFRGAIPGAAAVFASMGVHSAAKLHPAPGMSDGLAAAMAAGI